jgi:hypothetical protein
MPDVRSNAPVEVRMRAALDVHKRTIVCASQPDDPRAGELRLEEIPNTERALRALVKRLGGSAGLAVCYEAGPCGYEPLRLFASLGVACDVVAPSLVPVRSGDRVKTDRRDAKKLARALPRRRALVRLPADPRAGGPQGPRALPPRPRRGQARGAPPRPKAAAALRPDLRRPEGLDQDPPGLGQAPAARRSQRRGGASPHALPPRRNRCAAGGARSAARADRALGAVVGPGRLALLLPRDQDADRARALGRDRRLPPLRVGARADELPRARPERVLLRPGAPPRPHHQVGQRARAPSRRPGTTSTRRASRSGSQSSRRTVRQRYSRAPGRRRCASTRATASSKPKASARRSPTPRSRASSAASSGRR